MKMKPAFAKQAPRKGFTLVELMVVIAVILVIVTLLLPVLNGARLKAQQVDCVSRQKQWAMAFRMYVDDHDGLIPRESYELFGDVRDLNNWIQVRGLRLTDTTTDSDDVWYNALPDYVGVPRAATYAPPQRHAEFYESASLFQCPSARFPPETLKANYRFALFSIAMNSQLIEFPGPTIRFDRVRDESRTVLFLDNMLRDEEKVHVNQENGSLGQPAAYATRFGGRHNGGGNLAFADGHVRWFSGNRVVETDPHNPLRGGAIMPPVDIVWEASDDF